MGHCSWDKTTHLCFSTLKRSSFSNFMQDGLVLRDEPYPKLKADSLDCAWTALVLVQTVPGWSPVQRIFIWLSKCFPSGSSSLSWVKMVWKKQKQGPWQLLFPSSFQHFFLLGSRKSRMTHFSSHSHSSCQSCRSWGALKRQIWWGWTGICSIATSHYSCGENPGFNTDGDVQVRRMWTNLQLTGWKREK